MSMNRWNNWLSAAVVSGLMLLSGTRSVIADNPVYCPPYSEWGECNYCLSKLNDDNPGTGGVPVPYPEGAKPQCNIESDPNDPTVCAGSSATFWGFGVGGIPGYEDENNDWDYHYKWIGPNGFSADTQSITINPVQLENAGEYTCTVSDLTGCSGSSFVTLKVVKYERVNFKCSKGFLPLGETTTAMLEGVNIDDRAVNWSVSTKIQSQSKSYDNGDCGCQITTSPTTLTISNCKKAGRITVTATDAVLGSCFVSGDLLVKCANCPVCGSVGDANCSLGCVDFTVGLGSLGGLLSIYEGEASANLATPQALRYNIKRPDIHIVRYKSGAPRQVLAPQAFADVVTNSAYQYEVRLYTPASVGSTNSLGLYVPTGQPFAKWVIENPDASPTVYNRLHITKIV